MKRSEHKIFSVFWATILIPHPASCALYLPKIGELSQKSIERLTEEERIFDEGPLLLANLHPITGCALDGRRLARDIAPAHDLLRVAGTEQITAARDQRRIH